MVPKENLWLLQWTKKIVYIFREIEVYRIYVIQILDALLPLYHNTCMLCYIKFITMWTRFAKQMKWKIAVKRWIWHGYVHALYWMKCRKSNAHSGFWCGWFELINCLIYTYLWAHFSLIIIIVIIIMATNNQRKSLFILLCICN